MGAAENRAKSQGMAEYMKARGTKRTTGQCPWGCGGSFSTDSTGQGLMRHLQKCLGGGYKKRMRVLGLMR